MPASFMAAIALAAAAQPQSTTPPPIPVIMNPSWARGPIVDYPRQAMRAGIPHARVTLRCVVLPTGALDACEVLLETPPGYGFADAAIAGTARARIRRPSVDGDVSPLVRFNIDFRAPEPAAPAN